jgi:hypothetical protein
MTVPAYLVISQWILLLALALLVIIMYRQLGHVLGKDKAPVALGPERGTRAAAFEYLRVSDGSRQDFTPGSGQSALVAFVDPTCQSCEQLVESLDAAVEAGELAGFRVLLLTSDPPSYLQISDAFTDTRLELGTMITSAARATYNATATPLLVAIDNEGVVRAAGPARQRTEILAFRQASLLPAPEKTLAIVADASMGEGHTTSVTPTVESE